MKLTNLDRPLYPNGFTKGELVEYYRTIAPMILPWLRDRAITLFRAPLGVTERSWYQTNSPGVPPSGRIAELRGFRMPLLDTEDDLVWAAQLGTIELHPFLVRVGHADPDWLVLDLDPGEPAGLAECCDVALALRSRLAEGAWVKTSGSVGLHVLEPADGSTFAETKARARALAAGIPDVITAQRRDLRVGKVLVDVLQNDPTRSLIAPWSLRATGWPTVSTPVTWDEVEHCAATRRDELLVFDWRAALERASQHRPRVPDSGAWTHAG